MAREPREAPLPARLSGEGAPRAPDRLTPRVIAACDAVGAFIEAWGFRAIHGRVWTLLALHRAPVAQSDIAEALGVSRSLVSLAISELSSYGLVRAIGTQRNAPYEASMDVWPTITDVLRSREWMLIERARVALEGLIHEAEFAAESGVATVYDLRRMRLLLTMTEVAQAGLRAILSVRVPQSFDAFGAWLSRSAAFFQRFSSWYSG
jgi:DNA-binding transcriptional regulator GbsR (MarR family)